MTRRDPGAPRSRAAGVASPRRSPRAGERGAITAEAALVIPSMVLVALLLAAVVSLIGVRLQVIDAAREAARTAARGDGVATAESQAREIAGPAARVEVQMTADQVRVHVEAPALSRLPGGLLGVVLAPLSSLTIDAASVAAREDVL